ncbi:MAG TPA: ATP-binding protein [Pyrinomonadaceae bacterium]|nr:ATP-binding protein [Pyrinomonadaceae bacterium]
MKRRPDLQLITTFALLTFFLTAGVIFAWEKLLRPPFFAWVDSRYPGDANVELRWNVKQRVEHFFISITVDGVVVTLLVGMLRRQQRRLAGSEGRYRALFEHARDGIGVIEAGSHRLIEANSKFCGVLGCKPSEIIGQRLEGFLSADDPERPGLVPTLLDDAKSWEGELSILTASGAPLYVSLSLNPLSTDGEELLILIIRDLSIRKRLEAEKVEMQHQLFQSSKLASLGELSAGVAHEINNPLNGIINFAQLLKDESDGRPEFERQMIDGIIDEGERIAQIVRNLLTFARHDSQQLRRVRVEDVIRTSVALFGRQFEKGGIRVEVAFDAELPPVRADASRLRQVVVNLISNAHHALRAKSAAPGEGKLFLISARRAGAAEGAEVVRVEFFDNGVGIRREDLGRVFDPFFTTRRENGGTGLGLSISFGIIRDHGGTIGVESEEGRFTRFTVDLPAAESYEVTHA